MGIVSRWQIDGESLEPFEPLNELVRTGTNRGHRTTEPVSAFKPPQLPRGPTGDTALHEDQPGTRDQPGTQHYTGWSGVVGAVNSDNLARCRPNGRPRRAHCGASKADQERLTDPVHAAPARRPDINSLQKENGGSDRGARQVVHRPWVRTGNAELQSDGLDHLRAMVSLRQPENLVKVVQPASMTPSTREVACLLRLPPRVVLCPRLVSPSRRRRRFCHGAVIAGATSNGVGPCARPDWQGSHVALNPPAPAAGR